MENFFLKLDKQGLVLKLKENDLLLTAKNGKLTKAQIATIKKDQFISGYIKEHRQALVEHLKHQQAVNKNGTLNLEEIAAVYKLSPLQEGVLFHCLYEDNLTVYITQFQLDLSKNLHVDAFQKAWQFVIGNHTILRTAFIYEQVSVPIQCVYKKAVLPFELLDFSQLSTEAAEQQFNELVAEDRRRGFDFGQPPLIRITLVKIPDGGYKMIYTKHHILWDGWSDQIVISEVLEAYNQYLKGREPEPVAEDRYEDYIKFINAIDPYKEKQFWSEYLEGFEEPALLPFVKQGGDRNKGVGESKKASLEFDESFSQKIYEFVQAAQITPNTLVQAVWSFLLSKYTGKEDVVFGVTVSGRPADEKYDKKVGLFINAIPLRVKIDRTQGILAFLKAIQQSHVQTRAYQYTSINRIQSWTDVRGDFFDSIMIVRNFPLPKSTGKENEDSLEIGNVQVEENNNYLLSVEVSTGQRIKVDFKFNSSLLDEYYPNLFKRHFEHVLQQFIEGEEKLLKEIEVPTLSEKQQLLEQFNDTFADFPADKSLVDLWEEQVQQTPDNIALVLKDSSITYKELDERADVLANYLRSRFDEPSLIGLCVHRSAEMIVGLLGILKSGNAYIPIDPTYPQDRIDYIIKDSGIRLMVSITSLQLMFDGMDSLDLLLLDEEWTALTKHNIEQPQKPIHSTDLAYVIYTSGSTGRPKGVLIEHRSLVNFLSSMQQTFALNEDSIMLAVTTYSFDISYLELYLPLLAGGRVVLSESSTASDAYKLQELMLAYKPTHMQATPATWQLLIDSGWRNNIEMVIMTGGEAITEPLKEALTKLGPHPVWNLYGPTETTIWSTQKQLHAGERVSIGQPIANTQVYILDEFNSLCPIGVTGELCIGGAGLARGYLNRPELTAEKFIANPFNTQSNNRLYRTGDLARWLPNGELECLGRKDHQVKIRGYRIELGEIEAVLQKSKSVSQGVVALKTNTQGDKRLIAYVIPEGTFDRTAIIEDLKIALPDYMLPSLLMEMDAFPLTPNGKLDRKALPDPDASALRTNNFIEAKTNLELQQVAIWKSILGLEKIGVEDNFFEMGGHSLLATRLVSAIRRQMNAKLRIKDVFLNPTIRKMTGLIEEAGDAGSEIPSIKRQDDRPEFMPLSYSQERLWFIDKLNGSQEYHMPMVQTFSAALDPDILNASLKEIIDRHEALRTLIVEDKGRPFQKVIDAAGWGIKRVETPEAFNENQWPSIIDEEINQPFNLAEDFKLRATLYEMKDQSFVLILVVHHIAFDGWSANVFMKELMELYQSKQEKRQARLNTLEVQYADYSIWQRAYLSGTVLDDKLSYWEQQLANVPQLDLPTDFPYPQALSTNGASTIFEINPKLTTALKQECLKSDATPFMALLTVFKILLHRYTGQTDICVGSPVANRGQQETEDLIGFFVNSIALRSDLSGNPTFADLLSKVKETTLEGYNHQDAPFEKVVDKVVGQRSMNRSPIFQVMFSLNKFSAIPEMDFGNLTASTVDFNKGKSQYELSFSVLDKGTSYEVEVTYCKDLFKQATIEIMTRHFTMLLSSVMADSTQMINHLNMLAVEEKVQLLETFNNTTVDYPGDQTIVSLFETQVQNQPEAIALCFEDREMTFRELDEKSNQLAHYLRGKGVREEMLVAICVDRSFDMIVGLMGILKAGGVYVPIDPDYPQDRINYIIENANAKFAVSHNGYDRLFTEGEVVENVSLDKNRETIAKESTEKVSNDLTPENLMYVIYTSGSTGQPKGVMNQHSGLINRLLWGQNEYNLIPGEDALLHKTTFCFDVSVWELFWPLISGARMVIAKPGGHKESDYLREIIEKQQVSTIHFVPSMLEVFLPDVVAGSCQSLRQVLCSGEALKPSHANQFNEKLGHVELHNLYGPTEAAIEVTHWAVPRRTNIDKVPIGEPVANTKLYILNTAGNLTALGVKGELFIAGIQVARGYYNRPDLTAERFIDNPFSEEPNAKMYKTGDLARWLPDGNIEYLGRIDSQVKIRGNRIELGEIESVMQLCPLVNQCVVLTNPDIHGNNRLVAYIVPEGAYDKNGIQAFLKTKVPEYMVPAIMIEMDEIPLTPNGKIDRNAIKQIDVVIKSDQPFAEARNETEEVLVEIWKKYLGLDRVSIYDDFFESGGHSLLMVQLTSAIREQLEVEVPIKMLFQYSTIAKLSDYLLVTGGVRQEKNEDEFEVLDF